MVDLLRTKLFIPRPRSNLVTRPRLIERLNTGLDKRLTLIAAPAGFGKTTLLSEWIPQSPRCVTWLSLDESDNDPTQFWIYFISSLQELRPDLGANALALLQSPQAPPTSSILTGLINDLIAFPDAFASVLDDYHVVDSQPIHEALTFLIEHLPANMTLVLTTRVDPPLPLARLRARDQLTELRANDLRFSVDEATAFLSQVMGLNLSSEEVAALETRTEGWIAGLQIAALSMHGHKDIPGFIQAFSGSHRHILGYLAEEVLNHQSEDILNFLLQTSILDRLYGPLCDAVTGDTDGQEILEELDHANLFIIPLDDEGKWYRYHHLFAEVLQAHLRRNQPERLAELHLRASDWYEANNLVVEAVQHALAAGAIDQVSQMIEQYRWAFLERGQAITLRRWLDELPREVVCNRPSLSLAYAWIMTYNEQPETLEKYLVDAEQALGKTGSMATQQISKNENSLRGEIAVLRAQICLAQFDFLCVIAWCRQALQLLPEDNFLIRGWATFYLGHGEKYSGHALEAERAYNEASELGLRADNLFVAVFAQISLVEVQISMGRLREAVETTQLILKVSTEGNQKSWPVIGFAYWGLGILNYEWNDLDAAEHYLRLGAEYGQRSGLISLETISLFSLLLTLQAQGDMQGAEEMLEKIGLMIQRNAHPIYAASFPAFEAHLKWMQKHYEQAFHWADTCELSLDAENLYYLRERDYLTLARIRRTQGKLDGLQEVLAQLSESAENDKRFGNVFEIQIQQALLQYTLGKNHQAFSPLEHVLKMAWPEGYIRTFVDEGEPMHRLLLEYQSTIKKKMTNGANNKSLDFLRYIDKLLAAFPSPALSRRLKHETVHEPISERELEILRLITTGRSNQEIADILVIAVSTVKTHINHLYSKLGTTRRTQAIAMARDLGLLPK